jgi:arsenate reductase
VTLPLARRAAAEFVGTGLLVTAVVGSGIAAARLSPGDLGLELLENAIATGLGLAVLILVFAPVSGAHFNPVVSLAEWWLHQHEPNAIAGRQVGIYAVAQAAGGVAGAVLANVMFGAEAVGWSTTHRTGGRLWLGEVVATAGLLLLIFALARSARVNVIPAAVGAYIAAAYWFTSSTSFANPAVTIGRAFTDTFAGIAPADVLAFVLAQGVGLVLAVVGIKTWYPRTPEVVVAVPADRNHPTEKEVGV